MFGMRFLIVFLFGMSHVQASQLDSLLVQAAATGNIEIAQVALKSGANVNTTIHQGTALWWAVEKNHPAIVRLLLDAQPDIEKDRYDVTPLLEAVRLGHQDILDMLLKAKANPNAQDTFDKTPLMYAADKGDTSIVKTLLDAGAEVNAVGTKGWHALMHAAYGGHTDVVMTLLQKKAKLEQADVQDKTALLWAIENNYLDVVMVLIRAGANIKVVDANGKTALDYAADKPKILKQLTLMSRK
ncbi:MAG: ankyrin repeat domain-containing protein [Candidatus Latescibacterota bacterium]|jgi:ankyrin repeat protein